MTRRTKTPQLEELGARHAQLEAELAELREAMRPQIIAAYQSGQSVPDIAARAGVKRTRVFAWLKAWGVERDRGQGSRNRWTAGQPKQTAGASS